jgi:drug/metabolite transporter (DMT)-like permease
MTWVYMLIIIALTTGIWPVGRWAMSNDGQGKVLGFWISITAALASGVFLLAQGALVWIPEVWLAGGLLGIAYSVGFCVLIMGSMKMGPMSVATPMNNLAMVWGVLYSIFWLHAATPNLGTFFGIASVCVAMFLLVVSGWKGMVLTGAPNRKWLAMVLGGSAFSGLSFMAQTYVGIRHPNHGLLFGFVGFLASAVILAPFMPGLFRRSARTRLAGVIIGSSTALTFPLVVAAIHRIGAVIVLPVTVAGPMILVLLLGHFVYGERLRRTAVIACIFGAISVAWLACHAG